METKTGAALAEQQYEEGQAAFDLVPTMSAGG